MTDNTVDLLNNVEETQLDDDFESLTHKIEDLEIQNNTLDVPEELSLNTGVNNDLLKEMAEKLKTMPRNKILEMIHSLGVANQLPNHDFSTFSKGSVKSNRQKIQEKIRILKSKRTKFENKNNTNTNNIETTQSEQLTTSENLESVENINSKCEKNECKQSNLSRNQKKKLRQKLNKQNKLTLNNEHSKVDSNDSLNIESTS